MQMETTAAEDSSEAESTSKRDASFLLALGTYEGGVLSYQVDAENVDEYYGGELHRGAVRFIGWSGQRKLLTGGSDEIARVSDCQTSVVSTYFVGDRGCISAYAGSYGTKNKKDAETSLTTISVDGSVLIYHKDVPDPIYKTSFALRNEHTGKPKAGDLARAVRNPEIESLYAVLYLNGSIWLWNIEKKRELAKVYKVADTDPSSLRATDLCWTSDGMHLVILGKYFCKVVRTTDAKTQTIEAPPKVSFTCLSCVEDVIVLGGSDGELRLYRMIVSESVEKNDDFLLEAWLELKVPSCEGRIKLVRALASSSDDGNEFYIFACVGSGRIDLFEINGEPAVEDGALGDAKEEGVPSQRVERFEGDSSEVVEHSEILNCPYTITCMDISLSP